jgi:DNA polymerase-1
MVIGDSPNTIEIKRNSYLDGPAADILRKTMAKVGLPVADDKVYYTTAIKCAYPKRKGKQIPNEIPRNCFSNIIEEINAVKPRIVLILGKTAIQTVYGDTNIKVMQVMGRVTPIPGVNESVIAVPLLHPALIMRSPGDYKPFLASLQLVATLFKGGKPYDTGKVAYQILDTEELCDQALKFLATKTRVSADMETTGLDYRIVEFLVLGIGFDKNKVFVIPREMRHRVKEFFALENLKWTWQHGKYDTKIMWRRKVATVPLDHDVMYMHYTLDETSAHDLEHLSKVFLQAEAYKYKMNQNFKAITLENYPEWFESLCERVAVDCDMTYQLEDVLLAELAKEPALDKVYHNLIMPAAPFLARVEQNGLLVNPSVLEGYGEEYEQILAGIMDQIHTLAAPDWDPELYKFEMDAKTAPDLFNPASSKQMQWMVFKKLKLRPRIRKGLSTGAAILDSIEDPPELIKMVMKHRKVAKEYSTYVKGLLKWRDTDGRVRTNFSLQVTATGRLSSKEPNVQNIPSAFGVGNVRRSFLAPKGYIVMECDYTGAELRWLSCLSQCPVLKAVFVEGRNLHDETAQGIWGDNYTKQDRMRAKAVNFGIPYGREAKSFVDEFNVSMEEAQKMVDGWMNTYPGAKKYLLWCAEAVTKGYYLETPFGRRRRFGLVTPESLHGLQNEARNFPIQSASSDTTVTAAMELEPEVLKRDSVIVNLVHDSIMFYVPAEADVILELSRLVNNHMINVPKRLFGYDIPFESDTDIGFTWGDLKALNQKSECLEWEEKDAEGNKQFKSMPLQEWLDIESAKVAPIYEEQWYKDLEQL